MSDAASSMRLCFVVDYRSPIARNWIAHFAHGGHEVHVVTTAPVDVATAAALPLASLHTIPVAFTGLTTRGAARKYFAMSAAMTSGEPDARSALVGRLTRAVGRVAADLVPWVAPADARRRAPALRRLIEEIEPDVVHAMRIPYEGMLAAAAVPAHLPLVVSVWGNDFTLFAERHATVARATRAVMQRATVLHTDCHRDRRLAESWGWSPARPAIVLPGSGGVQQALFHRGDVPADVRVRWGVPTGRPVIFNPRSFRPSYVRNDTFFAAVPRVLAARPEALVMCVGMAGNPVAESWRRSLGALGESVRLLPRVSREEMADLFRLADISVSPSIHDGTPNTLLEAMACGACPVAGDIESIREWIVDGENGVLCDPTAVGTLTAAILRAVDDAALRERAARRNQAIIRERADYETVMAEAERTYASLVAHAREPLCQAS